MLINDLEAVRLCAKDKMISLDSGVECDLRKGDHPDPMRRVCNLPAVLRYSAYSGGYMYLCEEHGRKLSSICERWNGKAWLPTSGGIQAFAAKMQLAKGKL